jgi:hypothetical protein
MKNTLPCPLRAVTVARDDDSSRIATLKKASDEDGRATSQLSLALGQRVMRRSLSAKKLHESYRQAYIYFAINDGKIARCSEQVV